MTILNFILKNKAVLLVILVIFVLCWCFEIVKGQKIERESKYETCNSKTCQGMDSSVDSLFTNNIRPKWLPMVFQSYRRGVDKVSVLFLNNYSCHERNQFPYGTRLEKTRCTKDGCPSDLVYNHNISFLDYIYYDNSPGSSPKNKK